MSVITSPLRSLVLKSTQRGSLYVPTILIGTVFILLSYWSWRKWPDLLVDFGHQLYVPWRLVEGDILYHDLIYIMGPASQYFNALLFRIFSVSLSTLIYSNLVILIAIVFLIYSFYRKICSVFNAVVITLFFLIVFAFSQYVGIANYNYVCPYRHELTHGLLLILVLNFLYLQDLVLLKQRMWLVKGLCLGVAALLKTEIFLAACGISVLAISFLYLKEKPSSRRVAFEFLYWITGIVIPIILFVGLLSIKLPIDQAIKGVFTNWIITFSSDTLSNNPYYLWIFGFDNLGENLGRLLMAFFYALGIVLVALGITLGSNKLNTHKVRFVKWTDSFCMIFFIFLSYFTKERFKRPRNAVKKLAPILFRFDYFGYRLGTRSNTHLGSVNTVAMPLPCCHRLIRTMAS